MNKSKIIIVCIVIIFVALLSYYAGYGKGVIETFTVVANNVESMVDMELSTGAKNILMSHPEYLALIFTPETLNKFLKERGPSYIPSWYGGDYLKRMRSLNITNLNITNS